MENKNKAFLDEVNKEKRKIIRELKKAKVSEYKMKVIDPVVSNTAWMRIKLDEIREDIASEDIVVPYDNGGGQKGIRKNPFFDGYEALFKSYMLGMGRILDIIPNREEVEVALKIDEARPQSMLDMIREKAGEKA